MKWGRVAGRCLLFCQCRLCSGKVRTIRACKRSNLWCTWRCADAQRVDGCGKADEHGRVQHVSGCQRFSARVGRARNCEAESGKQRTIAERKADGCRGKRLRTEPRTSSEMSAFVYFALQRCFWTEQKPPLSPSSEFPTAFRRLRGRISASPTATSTSNSWRRSRFHRPT